MSPRPPPSHPTTTTTTAKTTATVTTTTSTTTSTTSATPPSHPPLCFRSMCRIRCGVELGPAGWEGGAQLGLVGSAVLEQRQVWRVEEVQMEGIRCKVGGEGACEEVFKVKKLTQVCFRQAFEFQKKMNMSQTGRKGRGNQK